MISVLTVNRNHTSLVDSDNTLSIETRIDLFGQEDHLRIFGSDFSEILKKADFDVEIVNGDDFAERFGLKVGPGDYDDNKVYICRK